jgi:hypothetical protein
MRLERYVYFKFPQRFSRKTLRLSLFDAFIEQKKETNNYRFSFRRPSTTKIRKEKKYIQTAAQNAP